MLSVNLITDILQWNSLVDILGGHPLQAWQWGSFKEATGSWKAYRLCVSEGERVLGAAQVLVRRLPYPFRSVAYCPRGPMVARSATAITATCIDTEPLFTPLCSKDLCSRSDLATDAIPNLTNHWQVVSKSRENVAKSYDKAANDIPKLVKLNTTEQVNFLNVANSCATWCKEHLGCISFKIEPAYSWIDFPTSKTGERIWRKSTNVMLSKTAIIDLHLPNDDLFSQLMRTTRYNIRKSLRNGTVIRLADTTDIDSIFAIYQETATAKGFAIHNEEYYRLAFTELIGLEQLHLAIIDGACVAFLWNITNKWGACELWAASNSIGRKFRTNYPLKWQAILAAKEQGAKLYDLNGLLDQGISEFKKSFNGEEVNFSGSFDHPLKYRYHIWDKVLALYTKIAG